VRLEIVRGGGLAGIVSRTELDSADLPDADARRLDDLCRAAQLEPLAAEPARGAADELLYELTLEDGGARRTARFTDATLPPSTQALVSFVDDRPERTHVVEVPGT
jgi:hypothetical protein